MFPNVSSEFSSIVKHEPLIEGDQVPAYWGRVMNDGTMLLFLAQNNSKDLKYPVYSGQSFMESSGHLNLSITYQGEKLDLNLEFEPYQSLILELKPNGNFKLRDIKYVPKDPVVKPAEKQKMYF